MSQKSFPEGLDGRMRDENGQIRQKRSDGKVETLRNPSRRRAVLVAGAVAASCASLGPGE